MRLGASSDAMVVVSKVEKELLAGLLPAEKVHLVSTVTVTHPVTAGFAERRGVLFVGGFLHPPNEDAVRYLLEEIWPLVCEKRPTPPLYIVGNHPPKWLLNNRVAGVQVLGYIPDLAPLYEKVVASIAPLRFGAGIKGKINESMAYGVPVVTTSIGSEGIPGKTGRNMLVA
ncbi:MAG: glycosyltransferase family 4 protein, partial [Thermodesulfobacteriota bacterium]